MKRRFLLAMLAGVSSCRRREEECEWRGILFGIDVKIRFRDLSQEEAQHHGEEAFALACQFESSFSLWDANSELRRLNRDGHLAAPSAAFIDCLQKAGELHQATQGLFDPTIYSYIEWAKNEYAAGRAVDPKEAEKQRTLVDYSKIEFSPKEVRLPKGVTMTLSAIAQGYVTDRVVELLEDLISSALVNFGEYRVVGKESWPVEVEGKTIDLHQALAVSSGNAERLSATSFTNHLIDPNSGDSPPPNRVVAVQAPEAWLADGLATVVAIGGKIPKQYPQATSQIWNS